MKPIIEKESILICFTTNGTANRRSSSGDEMDESNDEEYKILIPMIGYAAGNLLLVGETRVSDSQLNDFETNIDFSSYIGPCIKCNHKGNAFFVTNRFAISCKSLFEGKKEWTWKYSSLLSLHGTVPKVDYVNFNNMKLSIDELLHCGEDLVLLETPFFHHKQVVVPQIPYQEAGTNQWKYNCAVISKASQEDNFNYVALNYDNQLIKDFRGPKYEVHNEVKCEIVKELDNQLKQVYSNHGDVLVSFGTTCVEWKQSYTERQEYLCSTSSGCKGSVVRFLSSDDYVGFEKDSEVTQVHSQGNVSFVHGVHVGLSPTASANICILTTSQKFIYLYCIALLKENTYFKEDGLLPFPTIQHAECSLIFLEQVLQLESIRYKVQNKLAQLVELAIHIIRIWIEKYPVTF